MQALSFIERNIGYNGGSGCGAQGFGGSGNKGYLFSCSWEAPVIIFRDLGTTSSLGDLGSPAESKK